MRLMFSSIEGTLELTGLLLRSHRDPDDLADTLHRPATEAQVEVLHEDPTDPKRPTGFREKRPRLKERREPLKAATLRQLRIGEQETLARSELQKFAVAVTRFEEHLQSRFALRQPETAARWEAIGEAIAARKPGPKVNLQRLARVAAVYTAALETGAFPGAAVADDLGLSESRASAVIQQARQHGFLPPTTRGKPRGAPLPREEK